MPVEKSPARNGELPVLDGDEELKFSAQRVKLNDGQNFIGEGVLHLTTRRVVWLHSQNGSLGLAMDYPFVTLHALSTDKDAWPEPCLYCQLKVEEMDGDDEDDEPDIPELRFVPCDATYLPSMFSVFSEMSALNPDPADEQANATDSDEDDDDDDAEIGMQIGAPPPGAFTANTWVAGHNDQAMEDADEEDSDLEPEGDITMDADMK